MTKLKADAEPVKTYPLSVLNELDFQVDYYKSSGGGFAPLKMGIKVTHKPTGLFAECDKHRSDHANKNEAIATLKEIIANNPAPAPADQVGVPDVEPVAWIHNVQMDGVEDDLALSFSKDSFPLDGMGWKSVAASPLYSDDQYMRIAILEAQLAEAVKERNEWAAKWKEMRRTYGELRYPGMGERVIKAMELTDAQDVIAYGCTKPPMIADDGKRCEHWCGDSKCPILFREKVKA